MDRAKAMCFGRLNGRARGHINMLIRKIRSALARHTITMPKGATLALYSSRCDIRIDKARDLLGTSRSSISSAAGRLRRDMSGVDIARKSPGATGLERIRPFANTTAVANGFAMLRACGQ
jgi:hypothetical protein